MPEVIKGFDPTRFDRERIAIKEQVKKSLPFRKDAISPPPIPWPIKEETKKID